LDLRPQSRRFWRSSGQFATVVPYILISALLVGLSLWELRIEDGSRIFLAGENLWDGGQKRAILCLLSYADSRSDQDLQCFHTEIDVVLGDMQARQELDSSRHSYPVILAGFIRGRNRPGDIPTAITLYHMAAWNKEIGRAVEDWSRTDPDVLRLVTIADELQWSKSQAQTQSLKQEVLQKDRDLTAQERGFATHLNNGMRLLALELGFAQGIVALVMISLAVLASRRLMASREAAQKQVQFLAYYDQLTGLPNRILLHDRLAAALKAARVAHEKVAVLFLDLDRFKIINDSLGHSVGDLLLEEVAQRLKQFVRDQDTVGRVGGDEFLITLCSLDSVNDATVIAERILKGVIADFAKQGHLFNISCSIGISLFPDHGLDVETLIKNADAAMYCAKESGGNRLRFFANQMNADATERLTLENNLRVALERQELYLVYQPQMNIATGDVTGLEALLRWQHPEMGLIPPDRFIRVAESSGLILPIGEWVLRTACRQARDWQSHPNLAVPIAVNVSAVQFRQEGFCDLVREVLRETRLAPHFLELELTESVLLSNKDMMIEVLEELKSMGVNLTIDDFGTGYSSLSYLRQFPVSKLKIDRSFIQDVVLHPDDAAITSAIISMARKLNLGVIAEGVETEEQLSFLREQKCDELQGYYFSRPLLAEKLIRELPLFAPAFREFAFVAAGGSARRAVPEPQNA
jgi:diguanylate cyclase (GGDEF)-like protein